MNNIPAVCPAMQQSPSPLFLQSGLRPKPVAGADKFRVLIFPCGSECGLEIGRSLANMKDIHVVGASSVNDHGRFCFDDYIGDLPFVGDPEFFDELNRVVAQHGIDLIYPAMDSVVAALATAGPRIKAGVIGSGREVTAIALSKRKTYQHLSGRVRCPKEYALDDLQPSDFPVLLKPEIGYGSRGVLLARTREDVEQARAVDPTLMILEFLPGLEYTIDCFTNFKRELLFCGGRERRRIARGISVNTVNVPQHAAEFRQIAEVINEAAPFNGAWFFQVKRAAGGQLTLLEIAPRIAGSMGLHRCKGVNLPLLSVYNQLGIEVQIAENEYEVEYDRALYSKVRLSKNFTALYMDFDDCLLLNGIHLNPDAVKLMVQFKNADREVILITRHAGNVHKRVEALGIGGLITSIIHLTNGENKANFIQNRDAVLVDDSFAERKAAWDKGIAALGPDAIEALLK